MSRADRRERRRHPRIELAAMVEVSTPDYAAYAELHRLTVANVSRSGAYIQGHPPAFRVGAALRLAILLDDPGPRHCVRASARVVRVVPGHGFAVAFTRLDDDDAARLEALLAATTRE